MHRVLHRLARNAATHAIDQPNGLIDSWRLLGPLSFGANFEAGKWLTLLAQNAYHVGSGACTQSNQYQFHGSSSAIAVALRINHNGVPAASATHKTFAVGPLRDCGSHFFHLSF